MKLLTLLLFTSQAFAGYLDCPYATQQTTSWIRQAAITGNYTDKVGCPIAKEVVPADKKNDTRYAFQQFERGCVTWDWNNATNWVVSNYTIQPCASVYGFTSAQPTPSPTPVKTAVVFVVGLNTPGGYEPLKKAISEFYQPRLPANTPWFITQWDHDVTAEIKERFPSNSIVLLGHSFGGGKSTEVANDLGSKIKALILIDPVNSKDAVQNNSGLTITGAVGSAISFIRPFGMVPWTARINPKTSSIEFTEFKYNCEIVGDCHGLYVWKSRVISLVKENL